MPNLPLQRCNYAGCHELSTATYCSNHKALHDAERKLLIRGGYSGKPYGAKWDKLSKKIRHNEPVCRICGLRASKSVDHIFPKAQGGKDNIDNLQPLCKSCHTAKTVED